MTEKRNLVVMFCMLCATTALAQTFNTLANFDGSNGSYPYAGALVQGADGNLYGTTDQGGSSCDGTVFKITPAGPLTTLYSFPAGGNCFSSNNPQTGLLLATDGNFYSTTNYGGVNNGGTVFKITPDGTLTTLYSFCAQPGCADGLNPSVAPLIQGADGNLYGATALGGANGGGTIFKITTAGSLTTLYSFCAQPGCADGYEPQAGLVQADGTFYGTTYKGGTNNDGTVFTMTSGGTLATLHTFAGSDGALPVGSLAAATDGNFYGVTETGGTNNDGTVFKMTPSGTLTTLHNFNGADGMLPTDGLAQATDGNFYGTTNEGGANNMGTIFEVTPTGTLTTLHSFAGPDGSYPIGGLVQGTGGSFYGTTETGGTNNFGTVFSLSNYVAQVQPPINADGSSVFNAKRGVVPVKFTLAVGGTPTCQLPPATISLTRTAGAAPGPVDESVFLLSSDSGSNFRIDSCQYVYNLATGSLGPGTYLVQIMISGNSVGSGTFGLQ